MRAFVTGSRVYGTPKLDSDIDLVILTTPEDVRLLKLVADSFPKTHVKDDDEDRGKSAVGTGGLFASLRFGRLNLLCCTDPVQYEAWRVGTIHLERQAPVTRDVAVALFSALRDHYGLNSARPILMDGKVGTV